MTPQRTTRLLDNGLIWFGAAVSIAEMMTGTLFAPLGLTRGLVAIVLGHIIGCVVLFLAGLIGAKTQKSAMQTVQASFGRKGGLFFAVLNIVQLIGWTAIMIYDASLAANGVWAIGRWIWALIVGSLIALWIKIGLSNLGKLNVVAMVGLSILTVMLSVVIVRGGVVHGVASDALSFGAAVELSVVMPLSWLPLISDYTREAKRPFAATLVSVIVYGCVSAWMYTIGMGAALFTGVTDIAAIMVKAGLGVAALIIVVLSTVTTTFMDAYSAGVSSEVLSDKVKGKHVALLATALGIGGAILFPMDDISGFLYIIGSVFAPMVAIQISDHYLIKRDVSHRPVDVINMVIWLIGFVAYRLLLQTQWALGVSIVAIVLTMALCLLVHAVRRHWVAPKA